MKRPELRYWDHSQGPVPDWYWQAEREAVHARAEEQQRRGRLVAGVLLGFTVWLAAASVVMFELGIIPV